MNRKTLMITSVLLVGLYVVFFASHGLASTSEAENPKAPPAFEMNILAEFFKLTDDKQSDYPLADIFQGCPRPDCIPAIDAPQFIPATEASYLQADDLVIAYSSGSEIRVYPTRILDFHEIVNDTVDGKAIAITYCPLCGTGVAFSREIDGKILRLGVSGVLHGSDLVLYDDDSRSLWQQITGKSFAGPRRGQGLQSLPVTMTTWERWNNAHPGSLVLQPPNVEGITYKKDQYRGYRESEKVMFGGKQDPRLHPKRVVHGFANESGAMAFDADRLSKAGSHKFKLSGEDFEISETADGSVQVKQLASGKTFQPLRTFWFAWYTFHPDTGLWAD